MTRFQPGIDVLLRRHRRWLVGRRVGLVGHTAALDLRGCSTAERLRQARGVDLVCLFGPEHGFFGRRSAGRACRSRRHPCWGIPVHSLYGGARRPTRAMLRGLDCLVIDLQDIGARPYTYVATLRGALEAAAEAGVRVVVADRPIPLPAAVDGPLPERECGSFVCAIDAPLSYGMTPGETALWLRAGLGLSLDLRVAPMAGYRCDGRRHAGWPPWAPPSPRMLSWESAQCYPATVLAEALSALDHGRHTALPFQLLGASWTRGAAVVEALRDQGLPGVRFHAHRYGPRPDAPGGGLDGVRLTVTDPLRFRPGLTAVSLIAVLQQLYGRERVWRRARTRFFDELCGTASVRRALLDAAPPRAVAAAWRGGLRRFRNARRPRLLYTRAPGRT